MQQERVNIPVARSSPGFAEAALLALITACLLSQPALSLQVGKRVKLAKVPATKSCLNQRTCYSSQGLRAMLRGGGESQWHKKQLTETPLVLRVVTTKALTWHIARERSKTQEYGCRLWLVCVPIQKRQLKIWTSPLEICSILAPREPWEAIFGGKSMQDSQKDSDWTNFKPTAVSDKTSLPHQ